MQDRLALAKKRSREAAGGAGGARKKVEAGVEAFGKADDDEFIIGDGACSSSSSSSGSSDSDAAESLPRLRQIFVCSRTHSQLQQVEYCGFTSLFFLNVKHRQLVNEFKTTPWSSCTYVAPRALYQNANEPP